MGWASIAQSDGAACNSNLIALANATYIGGGLFNHFDGSVDLLDDLDDHYTARTHKKERNWLILELQKICKQCKHLTGATRVGGG